MPALDSDGFFVAPGPFPPSELAEVAEAYDRAFTSAAPDGPKRGSTSIRLGDLVNGDPCFELIYTYPALLGAARALLGDGFKLSAYHARTVLSGADAQPLHQDAPPLPDGFPLLGFIFMVDDFDVANGATQFIPGSQRQTELGRDASVRARMVQGCGPAGSMIIFNGSLWHGHGPNRTASPRRSVQGAFVRWDHQSSVDHARQTRPDVAARLSPTARRLLMLPE